MQNESFGVNEYCPTDRGIAGCADSRDQSTDRDAVAKTPPREDAAARTGGCSGAQARPTGSSTRDGDNNTGDKSNYLVAALERTELRAGVFFHGGGR